jgi:hypothetical protein
MFTKSLIAAVAIASVVSFAAAPAQAETNVDFNVGFGFGGFGPDYGPGYGFEGDYPDYGRHGHHGHPRPRPIEYGVSCGGGRDIVREAGFRHVTAYDCSAPTYGYKAWRDGDLYKVKVSYNGRIISVRPVW